MKKDFVKLLNISALTCVLALSFSCAPSEAKMSESAHLHYEAACKAEDTRGHLCRQHTVPTIADK